MIVNPKHLRVVASIDPAGSTEMKGQSSRMAIACIGADSDGHIFVLDAWAARTSTPNFVDRIFRTAEIFDPSPFGCEAESMQRLFSDTTQMLARAKGLRLKLLPVKQPRKIDKDMRIRLILQPIVAAGRLFLRADQIDLRDEILSFPQSRRKDLIDALATAINLLPANITVSNKKSLEQSLTDYHNRIGTPKNLLEYRLAQLRKRSSTMAPPHR